MHFLQEIRLLGPNVKLSNFLLIVSFNAFLKLSSRNMKTSHGKAKRTATSTDLKLTLLAANFDSRIKQQISKNDFHWTLYKYYGPLHILYHSLTITHTSGSI